jgi:hypothetical protein
MTIIFATWSTCIAQKAKNYNQEKGIKVVIANFYESPADCGFQKNISIYEAEVIYSLSIFQGTQIL